MRTEPAAPARQRSLGLWGLVFVLSGNMLLDALEVSIVIVALPSIGSDLRLAPTGVQWLMSGFALGFGATLLLGGQIIARLGRRKAYLSALLVFAVVSLLGGLLSNIVLLTAVRLVKGCCAALTAPTGLTIISTTFPEGPRRNRAVSLYSLFGASGFSAGLLLSGLFTQLDWRWTFVFPAPLAIALFVAGARLIPRDANGAAGERDTARLLPRLDVFANRAVLRSSLGAATLNGSYWGFLFVGTFQLQSLLGYTPLQTALVLLPANLMLLLSAPFSGRMVSRFGATRMIALGAIWPPLGYAFCLAWGFSRAHPAALLPAVLLVGLGFVLAFAALHVQALSGIPDSRQRMTGVAYQASVQLGGAVVLMVVAVLLGTVGYRAALTLVTAVGVLGLVVALAGVVARRRTLSGAHR